MYKYNNITYFYKYSSQDSKNFQFQMFHHTQMVISFLSLEEISTQNTATKIYGRCECGMAYMSIIVPVMCQYNGPLSRYKCSIIGPNCRGAHLSVEIKLLSSQIYIAAFKSSLKTVMWQKQFFLYILQLFFIAFINRNIKFRVNDGNYNKT